MTHPNTIDLREKDLKNLLAIFARFPGIREVRLFGSRARGDARRASDIDLAVYVNTASPSEWSAFAEAIEESPVIFRVDLVRMDDSLDSAIRGRIECEGIRIYP